MKQSYAVSEVSACHFTLELKFIRKYLGCECMQALMVWRCMLQMATSLSSSSERLQIPARMSMGDPSPTAAASVSR